LNVEVDGKKEGRSDAAFFLGVATDGVGAT
jgi:hypothetical protein